ncbi:hypothetical protein LENED_004245 [Lentinula edodes]|uniref:Uncharacterized protein n=1 Tax=Lentinula edodes TaxID=5353 RepID=A0A1Q3E5Q2_LENED|nr:hypothetical protein LENED_004245 [Lentinula edodes]
MSDPRGDPDISLRVSGYEQESTGSHKAFTNGGLGACAQHAVSPAVAHGESKPLYITYTLNTSIPIDQTTPFAFFATQIIITTFIPQKPVLP